MTESVLTHRLEGRGQGDPVLLLNGGMMTMVSWQPVAARLGQSYRVLLCDLRGQMMTSGPAHRELADNVEDLTVLLDHLQLERVHALGTSFGGLVGILLAALEPERVRSLVVVTASDFTTAAMTRGAEEMRQVVHEIREGGEAGKLHDLLVREAYSESYVAANRETLGARREQIAQLPVAWFEGLEGILTAIEKFDLRPLLGRVSCPTLVVAAAQDRVMSVERSRALAVAIPGAELAEHPTGGHALVAEDPAWLAEISLDFLGRVSATS